MGGIEFLREGGIPIVGRVAQVDKFTRAIPVAAAWNTAKILLPERAPWLDAFTSEVCGFTGVSDRHDDQVDALAAAFDQLRTGTMRFPTVRAADQSRWSGMGGRGFG
jgi:predicted phage terminase large subunit-like protein